MPLSSLTRNALPLSRVVIALISVSESGHCHDLIRGVVLLYC
mgnify:CR=1 FL=1